MVYLSPEGTESQSGKIAEQVQDLKAPFEESTAKVYKSDEHNFSSAIPSVDRAHAIARLLQDKNPSLLLTAEIVDSKSKKDGIKLIIGTQRALHEQNPYAWLEIMQHGTTTIVVPILDKKGGKDSYAFETVNLKSRDQLYKRFNLDRISSSYLEKLPKMDSRTVWNMENVVREINEGLPPPYLNYWWRKFREAYGFFRTTPEVESLISNIPSRDRALAVKVASERREKFLLDIWLKERGKLKKELIKENALTPNLTGWENYLKMVFEKDHPFRKRGGFEAWSARFTIDMLNNLAQTEREREDFGEKYSKVKGSYFDYYFGPHEAGNAEVWRGILKPIPSDSLLVHALSEYGLVKAVKSGSLGRMGKAQATFSQDRAIYDEGWLVVLQAKDLVGAGYPLIQVNEDFRDAEILREWRTIPVDINLARLIIPTTVVPDRKGTAQIATSYYGEDYLRQIQRI